MLLNVQKFIFFLILILLVILYSIFFYYHVQQQNSKARVILKDITNNLSETSYTLSKVLSSKRDIVVARAILDRVVSNNDFVKSALIIDDANVLLSTDPHYSQKVKKTLLNKTTQDYYSALMQSQAIEGELKFYEGSKLHVLRLLFLLDHNEIAEYFNEVRNTFLIYFGLYPIILLVIVLILIRKYLSAPLEKLRQFAYYQHIVPHSFQLKELEAIRYSMVQTFQRLETEKKELYTMARTDALSGLANRNSLNEYLQRLIADSKREDKEFALLFLDLDHFKTINDSLGHNVGDELLKNVASLINEVIRSSDFVARIGGDEFVIVLHQYSSILELTNIIQRIQKQLSKQLIIQSNPVNISSSIGIAFYPKDGTDIISLMQHADIAMYEAKQKGRARYHFFTEELNKRVQDAITLDKAMKNALKNQEYQLFYQPKVDLKTGSIIGVEALIRWIDPTKGLISPTTFIPLAEENGFIIELGDWVIKEAIRQSLLWKSLGFQIPIAVNISTKQILKKGFAKDFLHQLEANTLCRSDINIEITEYMFLEHNQNNTKVLDQLHEQGIKISLDDFGTGYSSLSYLKKFPIDYLKIDKSFIDDYATQEGSIFIETIVKMGQTLNIKIIAEGIETKEQLEYLHKIGCDYYQGYYFCKPVTAKEIEELFKKQHPLK